MVRNCIHFSLIDEHTVLCASPKIIHSGGVPINICMMCPLAETSVSTQVPAATVADCKQCEEADSLPRKQRDTTWCAVITTAPRPQATLRKTIASVRLMGLEPIVFAEPGSLPTNAATVANQQRLGVWDNWRQAAQWAVDNTAADKILTLQDDVVLHPQTKRTLETYLWPSGNTGFVSLYTPAHYQDKVVAGLHRVRTRALWGACALLWNREVLVEVLRHEITHKWMGVAPRTNRKEVMERRKLNRALIQNSDTAIGHIMNAMQKEMWFVTPSPAVHIATTSTINHGGNKGKRNCSKCADHKKPLKAQLSVTVHNEPESDVYREAVKTCAGKGMAVTFAISADLWETVHKTTTDGMLTAEFGSGVSTYAFSRTKHTAYEQDDKWAALIPSAKHTPLSAQHWYTDVEWSNGVPKILLIDGPYGYSRLPAFPYAISVLAAGGTVFIDDTTRKDTAELCEKLKISGGTIHHRQSSDKSWCTVTL